MPAGVFNERSFRNSNGVNSKLDTFVLDLKGDIYFRVTAGAKLMILRLSGVGAGVAQV